MRRPLTALMILLPVLPVASGCTLPETVRALDEENPPPELGRPGFVRAAARVGAVLGGVVGSVAAIALLPLTWPISRLAEAPLGYSRDEFMWFPVTSGAAAGHWVLGAPLDVLHYVFYRAWTADSGGPPGYDFVPAQPPVRPQAAAESAAEAAKPEGDPPR
jgi:hypothetical protein